MQKFEELNIPKEYKIALSELIADKRPFVKLLIDPEYYKNIQFEDPAKYRNDPDYLITLNCLGQIVSEKYPGIPANVPEELEQIFTTFNLEWESIYDNRSGNLIYIVAKNKDTVKRICKLKVIESEI
jgi:hypothetical protein